MNGLAFDTLRDELKAGRARLADRWQARPQPARYLAAHAALVDSSLITLCQHAELPDSVVLVAVGGYGRGELYPGSDVDVMLLLPDAPGAALQTRIERWVQSAWDVGLEIGHSVRTLDEALAEAAQDVTVQTALLEARHLRGTPMLFQRLRTLAGQTLDVRMFFEAKRAEQAARHARFDDSAYKLEPNLKDSPGGLRDLHTVLWIARAMRLDPTWQGLAREGFLTAAEARKIARETRTLESLRIHLHLLAGRREDRLAFDYQTELARRLGIEATAHKRAGERLMQTYYRAAKLVLRVNDILLQSLAARVFPPPALPTLIDAEFQARGELIEARDPAVFARDPSSILRLFLVYASHPGLTGFEATTLRSLWHAAGRIGAAFRANPENRRLFMTLFRLPQGQTRALRAMHRYGLLGRYIPAFGRIVGQMQHDLFHVYTVDEHILIVLRNLRRLNLPEYAHELPLASRLMQEFEKRELLYLAALFHDIAKGRGGDHSRLGAVDARRFCRQHGLDEADSALVAWLVDMHLAMSQTAQKEDIGDPEVVARFARRVGDETRLTALYLLTVADIRGTSPTVWNAWKGKLLADLYRATRAFLGGQHAPGIAQKLEAARAQIALYGLPREAPDRLWRELDTDYFQPYEARDLAWHARMLWRRETCPTPTVRARLSAVGEGIQVLVYLPDRHDLFARICGFFARIQYSVLEARLHTTRHGYALDNFQILDMAHRGVPYRDFLAYIEHELAEALATDRPPEAPSRGRLTRQQRHHPYPTTVTVDAGKPGEPVRLALTGPDRAGLLHVLAHTLMTHAVNVRTARIDTLGARVEDTFYIEGSLLATEAGRAELQAHLARALTA